MPYFFCSKHFIRTPFKMSSLDLVSWPSNSHHQNYISCTRSLYIPFTFHCYWGWVVGKCDQSHGCPIWKEKQQTSPNNKNRFSHLGACSDIKHVVEKPPRRHPSSLVYAVDPRVCCSMALWRQGNLSGKQGNFVAENLKTANENRWLCFLDGF